MKARAARHANSGTLGAFLLGSVACGMAWAFAEVLWTVAQPILPFAILRVQSLLPPENLLSFQAAGVMIYVPICLAAGLAAGLLARPLLARATPVGSFFIGASLPGFVLAAGTVIVWMNMLTDRPFFSAGAVVRYVPVALVTAGVLGAASWWLSKRVGSVMRGFLVVAVALPALLFAMALAAHSRIDYPPRSVEGVAQPGLPNIVFVTIDTVRADYVGAYSTGNAARTPVLDRLATEGVRFAAAITQVPTTTPSHASMFTSVYPFVHGAKNGVPMRPELATLPLELKRLGYHTAAFTSAYTTRSNVTGLAASFDLYSDSLNPHFASLSLDEVEPFVVARLLDRAMGNEVPAPVVNARVVDWLESGPPEPFFAWVHYFDAHNPYQAHEGEDYEYAPADDSKRARDAAHYKGEITYTDRHVGLMIDEFSQRGLLDDGFVLLTSDHGEAFGEPHPTFDVGHGIHLYDSNLWVPLILWGPSRLPAGVVVEQQVESIDLSPTILDLLGAGRPESFAGRSLVPLIREQVAEEERFAFSQTANVKRPRWFSIRSRDWKLLVNPDDALEELFDLRLDPGETTNLIAERPEVAVELRAWLAETMDFGAEGAGMDAIDEETEKRLRALGYLD